MVAKHNVRLYITMDKKTLEILGVLSKEFKMSKSQFVESLICQMAVNITAETQKKGE